MEEERDQCIVAQTRVGPLSCSTVFLGLDHNWGRLFDSGPNIPILFETLIFGFDYDDSYVTRCATWEQAEAMHRQAVLIAEIMIERAATSLGEFRALFESAKDAGGADGP